MARIEKHTTLGPTQPAKRKEGPPPAAAAIGVAADALSLSKGKAAGEEKAEPTGFFARLKAKVMPALTKVKDFAGQAVKAVRSGLMWAVFGPIKDRLETREVLNDPDTRYATAAEAKRAQAILAREDEATAAIAKLGDRAPQYQRLVKLVGGDIQAHAALQQMLLDGRLTQGKDLAGGKDMLSHLARMTEAELPKGVDRQELLTSVIEEAENPTKIAQEAKGTCVATSATILLARENPAEYTRLVADLATAGQTRLQNGTQLHREADFIGKDGGRTPSVAMLQPALMEYGNFFLNYDNSADAHKLSALKLGGGLTHWGADRVLEGLTGRDFDNTFVTRLNRGSTWKKIEASLEAGQSVPVGLFWSNGGAGGHQVLLDKVEGDWVYFTNPWGQQERAKLDEVKQHLNSAQLPEG